MSYDIALNDPVTGRPIVLDSPHHMRGGTYALGGSDTAELNVTYNYSQHFARVFEPRIASHMYADRAGQLHGVRTIYGLTGGQSIPILQAAIGQLADDVSTDYWEPTEGNAKRALCQLLALAQMRPDGVWNGD